MCLTLTDQYCALLRRVNLCSDLPVEKLNWFLPARRYASAGLCDSDVSVRPFVRPPHAGIVPSRAKAGS